MLTRKAISTLLTVVGAVGLGVAGYATRNRWMPYAFPTPQAERPNDDHHDGHDHAGHAHDHGDRVKLSPQAQANLNLDVDAISPTEYWRTVLIPGMVVDRPGESDRGVTARVAGVVTEIKARPGDTVKAGDPLFAIQLVSEYVQTTQTELAKVARELQNATAKRDRTANLVKIGTSAGAELIEDENRVKLLTGQVQAYRRQLQASGLTVEQADRAAKGEIVTEITISAPVRSSAALPLTAASLSSGGTPTAPLYEVQELKVQLGEQVQAGQTLCLLSSHQRLMIEGRAFKSEARLLAAAAEKKVPIRAEMADESPGEWPALPPLVIHHLSNQVDPQTRTFAFYLPLDNQAETFQRDGKTYFVWRFRPGQRVRLPVPVERLGQPGPDGALIDPFVLPIGAVVREGPEAFAFVQNGDYFERKPVRVLHQDRSEVVIANDGSVSEGVFVVRNNAAAVNRALKAAAAGNEGGHGHDHAGHSHDH